MSVVYLKTYALADIHKAVKKRPPGYLEAVLAAAVKVTETHVTINAVDAARITNEYGDGKPVTRQATNAEKATGGCGPCGGGKGKQSTPADAAWHDAVNQTEGM